MAKNREHRITNIAEDLPAMVQYSSGSAVEEFVQGTKEIFHGNRFGKPGRIAQVAQPDNRMNLFTFPALRLARENALAGTLTEIGLQEVFCRGLHISV